MSNIAIYDYWPLGEVRKGVAYVLLRQSITNPERWILHKPFRDSPAVEQYLKKMARRGCSLEGYWLYDVQASRFVTRYR